MVVTASDVFCGSSPITMTGVWLATSKTRTQQTRGVAAGGHYNHVVQIHGASQGLRWQHCKCKLNVCSSVGGRCATSHGGGGNREHDGEGMSSWLIRGSSMSRGCSGGAASARSAAGGWSPWPAAAESRTPSTSARCAGGVWKTTDAGTYWQHVSDGFFTTSSVGALAVAPSDSNVIYAGTGETTIRIDVSHGDGVYKSTDAGRTWTHVGLRDTRHIGKIRVHPHDPDIVWVAALGHAFGPNAERGVFKIDRRRRDLAQVLFVSDKAGAVDLTRRRRPTRASSTPPSGRRYR